MNHLNSFFFSFTFLCCSMDFKEEFLDDFNAKCIICLQVPRNAVAHECGVLYCSACWTPETTSCFQCHQKSNVVPSYRDRKLIANLKVLCKQCLMIFTFNESETHAAKLCVYRKVVCKICKQLVPALGHTCFISCSKCSMLCLADEINQHQTNRCRFRIVHCLFCNEQISFEKMERHTSTHIIALQNQIDDLKKNQHYSNDNILNIVSFPDVADATSQVLNWCGHLVPQYKRKHYIKTRFIAFYDDAVVHENMEKEFPPNSYWKPETIVNPKHFTIVGDERTILTFRIHPRSKLIFNSSCLTKIRDAFLLAKKYMNFIPHVMLIILLRDLEFGALVNKVQFGQGNDHILVFNPNHFDLTFLIGKQKIVLVPAKKFIFVSSKYNLSIGPDVKDKIGSLVFFVDAKITLTQVHLVFFFAC